MQCVLDRSRLCDDSRTAQSIWRLLEIYEARTERAVLRTLSELETDSSVSAGGREIIDLRPQVIADDLKCQCDIFVFHTATWPSECCLTERRLRD